VSRGLIYLRAAVGGLPDLGGAGIRITTLPGPESENLKYFGGREAH
jgi:hypothetical protein